MKFKKYISAVLSSLIMISAISGVSAAENVKGDANGDGKFTIRDAAFIASCLAQNKAMNSAADYDGDGKITIRDAAAIARKLSASVPAEKSPEQIILDIVNAERAKAGVAPLKLNDTMNQAAAVRAKELLTKFDHTRPDGSSCFTVLAEFGLSFHTCGENIAAGNSTAQATAQQWIDSPPHYENMLDPDFTEMGIGYAYGANSEYRYYWAQIFR